MRLDEILKTQARRQPDAPAIMQPGGTVLSYRALASQADQITALLGEAGLSGGGHVALVLPNGPHMLAAFFGAVQAGVAAPVAPTSLVAELEAAFEQQNAAAVIALEGSAAIEVARREGRPLVALAAGSDQSRERIGGKAYLGTAAPGTDEEPREPSVFDGALFMQTSGTTSRPKQFVLTHNNLRASIEPCIRNLGLGPQDRYLNVMPLFHLHGLMRCFWTIWTGGTIICPPQFETTKFFDWVRDFQPTWYSAVPAIHQAVLAEAAQHRATLKACRMRFAITNSAAMPRIVGEALEEALGAPVLELYGCSETCTIAFAPFSPRRRKPGSVGLAVLEVAVMNEAGQRLGSGEVGEIAVRGESVISNYIDDDEAQEAAFIDGWFRTGDVGHIDEDGFVFLSGRIKEFINRGGEKISPLEVDAVLLNHPAVAQAATFGVPHATLGEEVASAVVLKESVPANAEEIRAFAAGSLSAPKTPRQILITDEIPKSPTGKIVRRELAGVFGLNFAGDRLAQRPRSVAASTPLEVALEEIWEEVLGIDEVGVSENLFQLGGNSLTAMQIAARVADTLGIELPTQAFFEHPTIAALAKIIERESTVSIPE